MVQYVGQTTADAGIFAGACRERSLCGNGLGIGWECPLTCNIGNDLIARGVSYHAIAVELPRAGHDAV
jgi:hypothetical protein